MRNYIRLLIVCVITLVGVALLPYAAFDLPSTPLNWRSLAAIYGFEDCSQVTQISEKECDALVELYNDTGGTDWGKKDGWLSAALPCNWYGISCESGKVTEISLQNNNLTGKLPPSIGDFGGLRVLALQNNSIQGEVPTAVGNLTTLKTLALNDNPLAGPLPTTLVNLTALTTLLYQNTALSSPNDPAFHSWLNGVTTVQKPEEKPNGMDAYEVDNECVQASVIVNDGRWQEHTFHAVADIDWQRFDVVAGRKYRVEAEIPSDSPADVVLELYSTCGQSSIQQWNKTFAPGARLTFEAPTTGSVYVRLSNVDATVHGSHVRYRTSVRQLADEPEHGALIILAGRLRKNDPLQQNIHNAADAVLDLYQVAGMPADRIRYLATDSTRPGWTGSATLANLEADITGWAPGLVSSDRALTLYIIDHGTEDLIYVDGVAGQKLTATDLDAMLDDLEAAVPGVKINVIIEACHSGSFIDGNESISGQNRVIITSANRLYPAWASLTGADFSDQFFARVRQGSNLFASFQTARSSVRQRWVRQEPWLDGNGNGVPNEAQDFAAASERGFAYAGTFDETWPPHIFDVYLAGPVQGGSAVIEADVRDDNGVDHVWAVILPPDYEPPETSDQLVPVEDENLPAPVRLKATNSGRYRARYDGFDDTGEYRIIIYAEDLSGLKAQPRMLTVETATRIYLPLTLH